MKKHCYFGMNRPPTPLWEKDFEFVEGGSCAMGVRMGNSKHKALRLEQRDTGRSRGQRNGQESNHGGPFGDADHLSWCAGFMLLRLLHCSTTDMKPDNALPWAVLCIARCSAAALADTLGTPTSPSWNNQKVFRCCQIFPGEQNHFSVLTENHCSGPNCNYEIWPLY